MHQQPLSFVLSFVAMTVLSACSLAPDYQQPSAQIPAQYDPQSDDTKLASAAPLHWQQLTQDSNLLAMIDEVRAQNRTIEQARLSLKQLAVAVAGADAARLPTLQASASQSRQRLPADLSGTGTSRVAEQNALNVGFSAFELDLFSAASNAALAATERFYAGEASFRATELTIVSSLVSQYLTTQLHQQQLQLAARTTQSLQERMLLSRQRASIGLDNALVLAQNERELAASQVSLEQAKQAVAQDEHALALLLRRPLTSAEQAQLASGISPLASVAAGLPADLLTQRPDIMAAEHQLKASHANIGVARAAYFPSIRLTANAGRASADLSNLFSSGSSSWSFVPSVNLPLWDFGARDANLATTELERDAAVSTYQQRIETAFREVADSLSALAYGKTQLQAAQDQHSQALRALQLTQQREAAGLDSAIARLDAQRSWYTAASQQLQLDAQLQLARLSLFKALGGEPLAASTDDR